MATTTVSGRVDEVTKKLADRYLAKAGLTANEVIANIWRSIASSGAIPAEAYHRADDAKRKEAANRLLTARSRAVTGTPLSSMETADLREELARRA